jgi:subtilisin family serine protease
MKRLLTGAAVVLFAAGCSVDSNAPTGPADEGPSLAIGGGQARGYIVVFHSNTVNPAGVAASLLRQVGARERFIYEHAIKGFAADLNDEQAAAIKRDPRVDFVSLDGPVYAHTTQVNPPSWGLDRIDQRFLPLDMSYTYMQTGLGVTAYGIDTGIDQTAANTAAHPEMAGRVRSGFDAIGGLAIPTDDCHGHGTHTAGTMGATNHGVAKQVSLVAVRVLNCAGSGTFAQVIAGINWVTGDHTGTNPAVANMSLGGGFDAATNAAVEASIADGVFYSVSAGNSFGADACTQSPASAPNASTVAAADINDARANFSNIGTCVDIFAPGVNIPSTYLGGGFATFSGTSMSAPHVGGVAALYLQTNPSATPATVTSSIETNATPNIITNPGAGTPNLNLYMGYLNGPPNVPPTAVASLTCLPGRMIQLDGTGSSDSDGTIVLYEWLKPSGTPIPPTGPFLTIGPAPASKVGLTLNLTLRVTDNGGATDTDVDGCTILP